MLQATSGKRQNRATRFLKKKAMSQDNVGVITEVRHNRMDSIRIEQLYGARQKKHTEG